MRISDWSSDVCSSDLREIHRHLPKRDTRQHRRDRDPGVGAVVGQHAEQPQPEAPGVATHREATLLAIEFVEDALVAPQQQRTETEQLDLPCMIYTPDPGFPNGFHPPRRANHADKPDVPVGNATSREEGGKSQTK